LEDESPYPEVRSAVANTDDMDLPSSTLRAWVIGLLLAIFLAGINQVLFFRYPSPSLGNVVAQLISYPLGCGAAVILPRKRILGVRLNPGPFSIKEHVLITVMAGVGARSAYATNIVAVQRFMYLQNWSFAYQWLTVTSTQLLGFSIGGIAKRYLVSPPSMSALYNTLHSQQYLGVGSHRGIPRERFFLYAFLASAIWYIFPGYLFSALSYFTWVCWIVPDNVPVNQMFGYYSGLGMSLVTFDWAQIVFGVGSPLATPWWAQVNIVGGFVIFYWFLTPAIYYSNIWYSKYMPISSRASFDNTGNKYNVSRILTADATFDTEAYKSYSPLFISATFAVSYGLSFASITSLIVHTFIYFRRQIWLQTRRSLREQPDIHARLMAKYRQVPEWWYLAIFASMFLFGVISIERWPTQMPVWGLILALLIAAIYIIPVGMVQAITNQQVGLNVITELISGYLLPGRPIALMMFKTWGYISLTQGLLFTQDFKLGHYMKIPPRPMFWGQVVATVIAGTTQLGVQSWMFDHIEKICQPDQSDGFTCASTETFGVASVIWGLIGPGLQFSAGHVYYPLVYFFLLGAIVPLIAWAITKRYPDSALRYLNTPVFFGGTGIIPPATAVNFVPWAIVGFIFQYIIRRRHFGWWTKYNYVLSAALDAGVGVSTVLIFFCLQYPAGGTIGANNIAKWWGNTVMLNTADGRGSPLISLPAGSTFGYAKLMTLHRKADMFLLTVLLLEPGDNLY
ncbi:small oligopeptide transporter, partial [Sistotremastrum suecicum HHB10207 ss-3]